MRTHIAVIGLFLLIGMSRPALGQIHFQSGPLGDVLKEARDDRKYVAAYVFSRDSGGFGALEGLWQDPVIKTYLEQQAVPYAVDLDEEGGIGFAERYGVKKLPAVVFVAPTGEKLGEMSGRIAGPEAAGHLLVMIGHAACSNRAFVEPGRK